MSGIMIPVIGGYLNMSVGAIILIVVGSVGVAVYAGFSIHKALKNKKKDPTGSNNAKKDL